MTDLNVHGTMIKVQQAAAAAGYTEEFWFDGEATDTKDGMKAHRVTKVDGTLGGTATISTTQAHSATHSLKVGLVDENLTFGVTVNEFNANIGFISVWVYIPAAALNSDHTIFFTTDAATTQMDISVLQDKTVHLGMVKGAEEPVAITSAGAIAGGGWVNLKARWNTTTDQYGLSINGGADWTTSTEAQTVYPAVSTIYLGDPGFGGTTDVVYIDDFAIWTTFDGT